MAYVYRHIRKDKNQIFYIGIGVGYRANQKTNRSKHWARIAEKHGYVIEIMMDGLTWGQAVEKEMEFIKLYGRNDKKLGTLVNLTDGGDGVVGHIPSAETRRKISVAKKGINPRPIGWKMPQSGIDKMRKSNMGHKRGVGRVLSQESRNKIRNALIGKPPTTGRPILQFDLNGGFISEYQSANDVKRKTGAVASNITAACRKRMRGKFLYNKSIWRYKDDIVLKYGCVINKINITDEETYAGRNRDSRRGAAKLNMKIADEIRNSPLLGNELAKIYGVTTTCIYDIRNLKTWVMEV